MDFSKINWYPGHMKKSVQMMQSVKKNVDLFIEILDARAIKTSHNNELIKALGKQTISVALKSDLAPKNITSKDLLITNIYDPKFYAKVIRFIEKNFAEKKQKYLQKGLLNPQFNLMVVGLPNIGKSTFIKKIIGNKKQILVANQPGVTKKLARFKINDHLFIYDSPGIWFKRIDDFPTAAKLALINTIKHEVLPMYDLISFAYQYWCKYDYQQMKTFFAPVELNENFEIFLENCCYAKKFLLLGNQCDTTRCLEYFFKLFINGKIGVVNYDLDVL